MPFAIGDIVYVSLPARTVSGLCASFGSNHRTGTLRCVITQVWDGTREYTSLISGDYYVIPAVSGFSNPESHGQWVGQGYLTLCRPPVSLIHPTRVRLCVESDTTWVIPEDGSRRHWVTVPCPNPAVNPHDYCDTHGSHCERSACDYFGPERLEVIIGTYNGRTQDWCASCTNNHSRQCEHCNRDISNGCDIGSNCSTCGFICYTCADDTYYCDSCDTRDCDDSPHSSCGYSEDDDYDSDSYDNSGSGIRGYSYKPSPMFMGEGTAFLGLEIEIDAPARLANDVNSSLIYCKEDGSVSRGFEMVTHPMTYEWAMANFPFERLIHLVANGGNPGVHGLHIHISRTGFTDSEHVERWMRLFYGNETETVAIARRHSDQWASFSDRHTIASKTGTRGNRYQFINNQNYETFEIRGFASTLVPQELQAAMGFVHAALEFTRGMTGTGEGNPETPSGAIRNETLSWIEFATWVEGRPEYAPLWAEMTARTTIAGQMALRFDASDAA